MPLDISQNASQPSPQPPGPSLLRDLQNRAFLLTVRYTGPRTVWTKTHGHPRLKYDHLQVDFTTVYFELEMYYRINLSATRKIVSLGPKSGVEDSGMFDT